MSGRAANALANNADLSSFSNLGDTSFDAVLADLNASVAPGGRVPFVTVGRDFAADYQCTGEVQWTMTGLGLGTDIFTYQQSELSNIGLIATDPLFLIDEFENTIRQFVIASMPGSLASMAFILNGFGFTNASFSPVGGDTYDGPSSYTVTLKTDAGGNTIYCLVNASSVIVGWQEEAQTTGESALDSYSNAALEITGLSGLSSSVPFWWTPGAQQAMNATGSNPQGYFFYYPGPTWQVVDHNGSTIATSTGTNPNDPTNGGSDTYSVAAGGTCTVSWQTSPISATAGLLAGCTGTGQSSVANYIVQSSTSTLIGSNASATAGDSAFSSDIVTISGVSGLSSSVQFFRAAITVNDARNLYACYVSQSSQVFMAYDGLVWRVYDASGTVAGTQSTPSANPIGNYSGGIVVSRVGSVATGTLSAATVSNDDAVTIQSAVNAALASGGMVHVKPGNYFLGGKITIAGSNLWIGGQGVATTLVRISPTEDVFYTASQSGVEANYCNHLVFSDFFVTGTPATAGAVFNLNSVGAPHFRNVRTALAFGATFGTPTAYNGVVIDGVMDDCLIENCDFLVLNTSISITDLDGSLDGVIRNCWLQGPANSGSPGYGVYLNGSGGCKVQACEIQNHSFGIYSTGQRGGLLVSDCFIDSGGISASGTSASNVQVMNSEVSGGATFATQSFALANCYGGGTLTIASGTNGAVDGLGIYPVDSTWAIANSGTLQITNSTITGGYSGTGTLYSINSIGLPNILPDFGSAPTSTSGGGTAGTQGQIAVHNGILYLCTVAGTAGSATWTKATTTSV